MFRVMKKLDRIIRGETKASNHINILSHYDDETLIDKSHKLIHIIKIDGVDYVTKDDQTLDILKNRRNNLLKSFSSEFAIYSWEIRRKSHGFPGGTFEEGFAKSVNDEYKQTIEQSGMYQNELYLAVMTKPAEGLMHLGFNLIRYFSHAIDKSERRSYLEKQHQELCNITSKMMSALAEYNPTLLTVYEKNSVKFSAPMEFLSQLTNYKKHSVPLSIEDASVVLPRSRMFFNRKLGAIESRAADGTTKFSAMLSIKAYQPITYQGMLDEISALNIEYTITQSTQPYDRQNTKTRLRDQQNEMRQTKDESVSQTEQITDAFDDAASGEVGYGAHHLSLACFADSQEELNKSVATIVSRFSDIDVVCVREDTGCESAYWAQLPGNFSYIQRAADISTKNMAAFMSLHNYAVGKFSGNHWGNAVTIFETLSGSPYYFNFHYKDVGNFLIFGSMGSGKTLLAGFLILQSMKFGGKRVIFDKDRGLEIMVRAMNGAYEVLKPGIPSGFNPCQLDGTPQNRKFLVSLFTKMLTVHGEQLSESDISEIETVVSCIYAMSKESRQLCHIAQFFGFKKKDSLRARFDQWHSNGSYAWLFDNKIDTLNLKPDVLGFDLGSILSDQACKIPALMYLTYVVSQVLEGNRGILFIDEGWVALNDDYFKNLINDWSRTPRKKDNIFGLATQVANDTVSSSINKSIIESTSTKIFFPNPCADRDVHINEFGLTEREYEIVKNSSDDKNFFLLIHGRGVNKQSVVVRLKVEKMKEMIAVISARESTLLCLDRIRAEIGDDPNVWLLKFYEQLKQEVK